MIVVVAALKGGVGKTTTCVYLAALAAAGRRAVTLVDADPQASAADWLDHADDEHFEQAGLVEAPTERLLAKALAGIGRDDIAVVDTPPGHERLLAKALQEADVVVLPTRVGGVETPGSKRCWRWCPAKCPSVWFICSARTYTRDFQEAIVGWAESEVPVWGNVPERVSIAAGPDGWLSVDGLDAYRGVWRRVVRAGRES